MSKWLALASAYILLANPAQSAAQFPSAATVEPKINELFKKYDRAHGPGCAVGVYNAGRVLFAKGFGQADLAARRPISPKTVFDIASLSKQFTAFAVALLEREGKLSLNSPVRRYVPELPEFGAPITVRHLIHHTSGLRDFGALMELTGWKLDQEFSKGQLLKLLARQRELNFAPGTSFEYGNTNYVLLGMIIERVSGRSYGDFLADRIFRPLGMASSAYGVPTAASDELARNYAPHGQGFFVNHVWARAYAPGVVNVHSSIDDLARWDSNFNQPVVGDPALIETLYTPPQLSSGESTSYAYGLDVGNHRGWKTVSHSGLGGGSFYLLRFPEQRLSVATLCNEYGVGPNAPPSRSLSFAVADLFLPPSDAARQERAPIPPAVRLSQAELETYAGDYWVADEGTPIPIRMAGDVLAEIYDGKPYPMIPTGPGRFRNEDGEVTYSFTGRNGDLLTYHEAPTNYTQRAQRRPAWTPSAADMRQLGGRYCSSEADACWSIETGGAQAWLIRPGFPRMLLKPAFADTFRFVDNHWIGTRNVRITIERHRQDGISGFRVSRARVRNVLFKRTV